MCQRVARKYSQVTITKEQFNTMLSGMSVTSQIK
jgi:hypothetical protein